MRSRGGLLALAIVVVSVLLGTAGVSERRTYVPSWDFPTAESVEEAIRGLGFREFVDEGYRSTLLMFPQTVTARGLDGLLGVRNDRLNVYSEDHIEEVRRIGQVLAARLREFDRGTLSRQDQITYDVCASYWGVSVEGAEDVICGYPLHPYAGSPEQALIDHLVYNHRLDCVEDVVDYLTRLHQVDDQLDQIGDRFEEWIEAGGRMPRSLLLQISGGLSDLWTTPAVQHPLYEKLTEEIDAVPDLSQDARRENLADAREVLEFDVLPAFQRLASTVSSFGALMPAGSETLPVSCSSEAYTAVLQGRLGLSVDPTWLHQTALEAADAAAARLIELRSEVGAQPDASHVFVFYTAYYSSDGIGRSRIVETYEGIIDDALHRSAPLFEWLPEEPIEVIPAEIEGYAYFRSACWDGSCEAAFVVPVGVDHRWAECVTLAYHEAIPGHYLQRAWAQQLGDLPLIRKYMNEPGFVEGWATYAEDLAWESGWYEADPLAEASYLFDVLWTAAQVVVDTGVYALGWTFDQVLDYLDRMLYYDRSYALQAYHRVLARPARQAPYLVGRLHLAELRDRAEAALGERFSLPAFHTVVLENGSISLAALAATVCDYVIVETTWRRPT